MKSNIVGVLTTLIVAFVILSVSFLKIATLTYTYSPMVLSEKVEIENPKKIDYVLAYQGKIGPDSSLWYLKVFRDKIWYTISVKQLKKAGLNLLFADKRLNSSVLLFKNNKPDLGLSTLTKAEKYLEKAESIMPEDMDLYKKMALSSLKHIEVIEYEILPIAPDDLKPEVIKIQNLSKETYKKIKEHILSKGLVPPQNPFEMK